MKRFCNQFFFVIYIPAARSAVGYVLCVMLNEVVVLHLSIACAIWYSGLYTAVRLRQSICGVIKFQMSFVCDVEFAG